MVIGLSMRDIFSQKRLLLSAQANEIFQEIDQRIFIEFFGIDKENTKMLIG